MHEAYLIAAAQKNLAKIETIASYDNCVLIASGRSLLVYQINASVSDDPPPTALEALTLPAGSGSSPTSSGSQLKISLELTHCIKAFCETPVRQMAVIADHQLLIILTNDLINVHDMRMRSFPLVHGVAGAKGASLFELDVKRERSLTGETVLMVRMVVAVRRKLQFWYWKKSEFLRLPMADIDLSDIPRALRWCDNTIMVALKSEYLYYDVSESVPLKVELFPTGGRAQDPCVIRVGDCFAVTRDEMLIAVQAKRPPAEGKQLPLAVSGSSGSSLAAGGAEAPDADAFRPLALGASIQSFVWDEPYLVALTSKAIEVHVTNGDADNADTLIQRIESVTSARFLLRSRAGFLIVASNTSFWCVQAVDVPRQRQTLLQQHRFHLALQLTAISPESPDEKAERKHHIQTAYAYDLFRRKAFRESMEEFEKLQTDICDVIRLYPDLLPSSGSTVALGQTPTPPVSVVLDDRDLENGLLALINFLTVTRYHVREELQLKIVDSKRFGTNLNQLQSIIDTVLLKCYLKMNLTLVPSLIRGKCCHFDESEKVLRQHRKLDELKLLYEVNGKHRQALELLKTEAARPNSPLAGHDRTMQYLMQLDPEHEKLILEYARWVLDEHPDDGLQIFVDDQVEQGHISRFKVLDFLLRLPNKSLVTRYLEHVVNVWSDRNEQFHELLIKQYLEEVLRIQADINGSGGSEASAELHSALAAARQKLLGFLRSSAHYRGEHILVQLPYTELFEERAVVLGKLRFHDKCIAIYVQVLGDLRAAAEHCDAVYTADPTNDAIYVTLAETLLTVPTVPPYGGVALHPICQRPNIEFVLELLDRHASRFNAPAVLQLLPGNVPLLRVRAFLERVLNDQLRRQHDERVMRALTMAETVQLEQELLALQSGHVLLTDLSVCPECGKKFNVHSAFVRQPNGRIVHYLCTAQRAG